MDAEVGRITVTFENISFAALWNSSGNKTFSKLSITFICLTWHSKQYFICEHQESAIKSIVELEAKNSSLFAQLCNGMIARCKKNNLIIFLFEFPFSSGVWIQFPRYLFAIPRNFLFLLNFCGNSQL